jgi:hypothetical protein
MSVKAHGAVKVTDRLSRRSRQLMSLGIAHPESLLTQRGLTLPISDNRIFAEPVKSDRHPRALHDEQPLIRSSMLVVGQPWLRAVAGTRSQG